MQLQNVCIKADIELYLFYFLMDDCTRATVYNYSILEAMAASCADCDYICEICSVVFVYCLYALLNRLAGAQHLLMTDSLLYLFFNASRFSFEFTQLSIVQSTQPSSAVITMDKALSFTLPSSFSSSMASVFSLPLVQLYVEFPKL